MPEVLCAYDVELNVTICFSRQNKKLLWAARAAFAEVLGPAWVVEVTGGLEGTHGADSKHYQNGALDFRTGHTWEQPLMTREQALAIRDGMQRRLGMDYDIILEEPTPMKPRVQPHIHGEFDPKRGPVPVSKRAA